VLQMAAALVSKGCDEMNLGGQQQQAAAYSLAVACYWQRHTYATTAGSTAIGVGGGSGGGGGGGGSSASRQLFFTGFGFRKTPTLAPQLHTVQSLFLIFGNFLPAD
jgi:hypothetical protein